jgi:hypothetical protein
MGVVMKTRVISFAVLALSLAGQSLLPQPAFANAIINPIFDTSITSLSNASAIEQAFNRVASDYSSQFSNPVTVNILVSWGSVDGSSLPSNAVGASVDPLYGYFSYAQIRNALTSFSQRNPSDTALASVVRNLPQNAPSGTANYVISSAEAKALGLISRNGTATDGYIGFAGSTSSYDFDPSNGVTGGTYDFEAVAAHEMAEVLGRISGLEGSNPSYRTPFDLLRYSAPGQLSFSYDQAAYLSIDGGKTNLGNFNISPYGGDRSYWQTLYTSTDVQDAFISTGQSLNLSYADLTALDALGWGGSNVGDTASGSPNGVAFALVNDVPEPGSLAMFAFGLAAFAFSRRRLRAASYNSRA